MSYQSKYTGSEIDAGIDAAKAALPKNGGTMVGALILAGDPADENAAVTKKYVDDAVKNIELTPGENGEDGVSVTHSWNGTVLSVTSASGTSSADLKGEKGDSGSDANVNAENIKSALGYTPADAEDVNRLSVEIEELNDATFDTSNMFNKDTVLKGYNILANGTVNEQSDRFITDYINVDGLSTVYFRGGSSVANVVIYNNSKEYIAGVQLNITGGKSFNLSAYDGAYYIRLSDYMYRKDTLMISAEHQETYTNYLERAEHLFTRGENLFNPDYVVEGYTMNAAGTFTEKETSFVSGFIPIESNDIVYFYGGTSAINVCIYNSDETRIKGLQINASSGGSIDISSYGLTNPAFLRFSDNLSKLGNIYVCGKTGVNRKTAVKQIAPISIKHLGNMALNYWQGKSGDSLGDSLTGQGYYQDYTRKLLNLYKYHKHGISGTKMSGAANTYGDSMWMDSRINALNSDVDFVTIMGGQNDGVNVQIGEISLNNCDTNTYIGALNVIISKLYYRYNLVEGYYADIDYTGIKQETEYRGLVVIPMTTFRCPSDSAEMVDAKKEMADAVKKICDLWGLPCVDNFGESQLNFGNFGVYWDIGDSTHPKESAYRDKVAPLIASVLDKHKPINYALCSYIT